MTRSDIVTLIIFLLKGRKHRNKMSLSFFQILAHLKQVGIYSLRHIKSCLPFLLGIFSNKKPTFQFLFLCNSFDHAHQLNKSSKCNARCSTSVCQHLKSQKIQEVALPKYFCLPQLLCISRY